VTTMPRFHRNALLGFVLHGNKLWLSEFFSIILLALFLISLSYLFSVVFVNQSKILENNAVIAQIKQQNLKINHEIQGLRDQQHLFTCLKSFVGNRIPLKTISYLVNIVHKNSRTYGYDPLLVLSVIKVESYFDARALGRYRSGKESGAFGLMQLKLATAQEVAEDLDMVVKSRNDLFKPEINIPLGIAYLTRLISAFQNLKLGILAYNQGPGTIRSDLRNKRPLSVRYYNKVLRSYYHLKKIAEKTSKHSDP